MASDAIHYLSLTDVSVMLGRGDLKPTTLTETILARVTRHDSALKGIANLTDVGTCTGNWGAIASHHVAGWTQVSCRQVRNAFARTHR